MLSKPRRDAEALTVLCGAGLVPSSIQGLIEMARNPKHSVRYRMWNQGRLAMHVDTWFHTWDVLGQSPSEGQRFEAAASLSCIRQTLFQSMIVHLDFIETRQGVGLKALVVECRDLGLLSDEKKIEYLGKIHGVSRILQNIGRQRNNIVAHRSDTLSFKDVNDKFPVTGENLRECADVYHYIAHDAYNEIGWFTNQTGDKTRPWELNQSARRNAEDLLARLTEAL